MMTAVTYGLYSALIAIAVTLIEYATGIDRSDLGRYLGFLGLVGLAVMIFFAIKARKDEEFGGRISYGQCVGTGVMVALVSSAIIGIFMFIYVSYVNPDIIDYIVEQTRKSLAAKNMTQEQMDGALQMTRKFASPTWQSVMAFLGGTFIGLIIALIMGAFLRSKEEEEQIRMA
jgi:hypothetical protein